MNLGASHAYYAAERGRAVKPPSHFVVGARLVGLAIAAAACVQTPARASESSLHIQKGRAFALMYYRVNLPVSHISISVCPASNAPCRELLDQDVQPMGKPIPVRIDEQAVSACDADGCTVRVRAHLLRDGRNSDFAKALVRADAEGNQSLLLYATRSASSPNTVVSVTPASR